MSVINIPRHEVVLHPRKTVQKLCNFLGVTIFDDRIQEMEKILYARPSVTDTQWCRLKQAKE